MCGRTPTAAATGCRYKSVSSLLRVEIFTVVEQNGELVSSLLINKVTDYEPEQFSDVKRIARIFSKTCWLQSGKIHSASVLLSFASAGPDISGILNDQ